MPILLDLILPVVFGFTLCEFVRTRKPLMIILCIIFGLSYSYLKFYPQLIIEVTPKQAAIYVDGEHVGSGKMRYRVPFGSHYVRFNFKHSPFFPEAIKKVQTSYYGATKVIGDLEPKKGTLYVCVRACSKDSPLRIASVSITSNGGYSQKKGESPFLFTDIPAGTYLVQVQYEKGGEINTKDVTDVFVLENMGARIEVTL